MADIEVELVATAGKLWSGTARMVSAKAGDGEIGILAGHEPILSVLLPGEVRVYPVGRRRAAALAGRGRVPVVRLQPPDHRRRRRRGGLAPRDHAGLALTSGGR